MPLSEHEQRQLEQIEQALYREDPKFGRLVRSSDPRVHYKRKLAQALIGIVVGAGLLAAGVVTRRVYLEPAGAAILVLSVAWAVVSWRRHLARVRPARPKPKARPGPGGSGPGGSAQSRSAQSRSAQSRSGRSRSGRTRRARMMERMEERWRRRQEGDRRM